MKKHKIKSFCKINLSLRILSKLSNGYHSIASFITFCDLYDEILIKEIYGTKDKISFSGKFKKKIDKKNNTITKVLGLLRKNNFLKKNVFQINVKKNIPHGSGLGGGSANAANLLKFLNIKKQLKLKKNQIIEIANKIGFDVPINFERKNTFLTGKKRKILRFNNRFKLNILLVYPNIICSTKRIYQKNKKFSRFRRQPNFNIMNKKKLIIFLKNEKNDLEKTAIKFYPRIEKIINIMNAQNGCCFSRITGSGSACIGIFSNMKTAIYAQKLIKQKFPKYWSLASKTI